MDKKLRVTLRIPAAGCRGRNFAAGCVRQPQQRRLKPLFTNDGITDHLHLQLAAGPLPVPGQRNATNGHAHGNPDR